MSTNFLSLLKSKNLGNNQAIKIDSNFGTKDQTIVDLDDGRSADVFKIPQANGTIKNVPYTYKTPDVKPINEPILVRCERVIDRNRLDLFFSAKPSEETRDLLKDQGFKFNPDSLAWYHKDTTSNRLFLATTFNLSELMIDSFNDDPKPEVTEVSSEFSKFRSQVDRLVEHLKISPADLMLQAIECLHDKTFKVN